MMEGPKSIPVFVELRTSTTLERRRDDARDLMADARATFLAGLLILVLAADADGWSVLPPLLIYVALTGVSWWASLVGRRTLRDIDSFLDESEAS